MSDRSAIPGTAAHEMRLLHEAMRDAKTAARQLREAAAEQRRSADDARQAKADLDTLVEKINTEVAEAPETIKLKLQPPVEEIVDRLIEVGDTFKEALQEKWQELLDHEVKVLGFTSREELVDIIASKITLSVVASAKRIQTSRDQETEAIKGLTEMLPDLNEVLNLEQAQAPPKPPAPKNRGNRRGHSHNRHRRRLYARTDIRSNHRRTRRHQAWRSHDGQRPRPGRSSGPATAGAGC